MPVQFLHEKRVVSSRGVPLCKSDRHLERPDLDPIRFGPDEIGPEIKPLQFAKRNLLLNVPEDGLQLETQPVGIEDQPLAPPELRRDESDHNPSAPGRRHEPSAQKRRLRREVKREGRGFPRPSRTTTLSGRQSRTTTASGTRIQDVSHRSPASRACVGGPRRKCPNFRLASIGNDAEIFGLNAPPGNSPRRDRSPSRRLACKHT